MIKYKLLLVSSFAFDFSLRGYTRRPLRTRRVRAVQLQPRLTLG